MHSKKLVRERRGGKRRSSCAPLPFSLIMTRLDIKDDKLHEPTI